MQYGGLPYHRQNNNESNLMQFDFQKISITPKSCGGFEMIDKNFDFYYIRDNNSLMCIYPNESDQLCLSEYVNGYWSDPFIVCENIYGNFSAELINDGSQYAVYVKGKDETVWMFKGDKHLWDGEVLRTEYRNASYQAALHNDTLHFLYEVDSKPGVSEIRVEEMPEYGVWKVSEPLDTTPITDIPFKLKKIANGHYIVFYQRKGTETLAGYREISLANGKRGHFKTVLSTIYRIKDYSFLVTEDAIHYLCIVRNSYNSQLVYRKKEGSSFDVPIAICESPRMDSCLLFILKEQIWAVYISGNSIFISISEDTGKTFKKPSRFRISAPDKITKGTFLTNTKQSEKKLYINEIYCDSKNPGNILIFPDIYDGFFPEFYDRQNAPALNQIMPMTVPAIPPASIESENVIQPAKIKEDEDMIPEDYHSFIESQMDFSRFMQPNNQQNQNNQNQGNTFLKQQVDTLSKQLDEKNRYIISLNNNMKVKKNELSDTNRQLSETVDAYRKEIDSLRDKYDRVLKLYQTSKENLRITKEKLDDRNNLKEIEENDY